MTNQKVYVAALQANFVIRAICYHIIAIEILKNNQKYAGIYWKISLANALILNSFNIFTYLPYTKIYLLVIIGNMHCHLKY